MRPSHIIAVLAVVTALGGASPIAAASPMRAQAVEVQRASTPTAGTPVAADRDEARYAARQAADPEAGEFKGGSPVVIVISTTTLVVALIIALLLL